MVQGTYYVVKFHGPSGLVPSQSTTLSAAAAKRIATDALRSRAAQAVVIHDQDGKVLVNLTADDQWD